MKIRFTRSESRSQTPLLRPVRQSWPDLPGRKLIAVGAAALLLAGCSSGGSDSATSGSEVSGRVAARDGTQFNAAPDAKTGALGPVAPADASKRAAAAVSVGPKLTKSASLDLRVKEIGPAAARVRSIATGLQAQVLSEQIGRGGPGNPQPLQDGGELLGGFGTITLSVPADNLDSALDQLAKIGTVLARNTAAQDVTSRYVDTESRLKTMRSSVERVRALMAQAKDIGQVVALESEMSRRQADLESLQSQLDSLKTSVERSTLAVSLSTPGNEPVTDNGFVAGLRSGWDAFAASAAELFRGIGAVLPFAVFFALVGAPIWWAWRRQRANRPPTVSTPLIPTPTVPSA